MEILYHIHSLSLSEDYSLYQFHIDESDTRIRCLDKKLTTFLDTNMVYLCHTCGNVSIETAVLSERTWGRGEKDLVSRHKTV